MVFVFFFKQKTAYEMRISDWSSDVCSSDLEGVVVQARDQVLAGQFADVTPGVAQRALQRRVAEAIAQRGGVLDLDEIQRAARLLRDRRAQPLQPRRARARKGTRLNSRHYCASRMPSSAGTQQHTLVARGGCL